MLFSLPLNRSDQNGKLSSIIEEIVRFANPEKILLLSATYNCQFGEDIFQKNSLQKYTGARYELLLITDGSDAKTAVELAKTISRKIRNKADLHLHTIDIHKFNALIDEGDEYLKFILLNAFVGYDRGSIPLVYSRETA